MTEDKPDNWQRLEELFEAAGEYEGDRRDAFLADACAGDSALRREVEALLAAGEQADEVLESSPVGGAGLPELLDDIPANVPEQIGKYRIKGVIASGGMGTVYEAEQEHPHRTVALKVMRWSLASPSVQRRFQYESQVLARLRHPGIAQVFEAGTHADGAHRLPYFAMEYVGGARPITEYADQQALDTRRRLELFAQVCDAVDHGHQKGVIHRDLKPGNILVDADGQPRVIDFGIARSTGSDIAVTTMQTSAGELIGTLQYMSPEQCLADPGDIDTRSDVYSLGVVLYELLCGKLPYDLTNVALHQATQVICDQPPTKLSTVDRGLRGDPETIVRKALAKDRHERYRSAAELAGDIRRYLAGEAITAHPPSAMYQLRKFARRHKALVAGVAMVFVILLASAIVSTVLYSRAESARADEGTISEFFLRDILGQADLRRGQGPDVKLRKVLDEAARRLEKNRELASRPRVKAALHAAVGNAYVSHNAYEPKAEEHVRTALEIRRRIFGPDHPKVAESLHDLAVAIWFKPKPRAQSPRSLLRQALAIRRSHLGENHSQTLMTKTLIADWLCYLGKAEAEQLYREVLKDQQEVLGPRHKGVANTLNKLGQHLHWQNRLAEAEPLLRKALAIRTELLGADSLPVGETSLALGLVLDEKGESGQAELLLKKSLAIHRAKYNPEHVIIGHATRHLGELLLKTERFKEAEPLLRESLENQIAQPIPHKWYMPIRRLLYGRRLTGLGRSEDAERELFKVLKLLETYRLKAKDQTYEEVMRPRRARIAVGHLADLYEALGKPDQAAKWRAKLSLQTQPAN